MIHMINMRENRYAYCYIIVIVTATYIIGTKEIKKNHEKS